MHPLVLNCILLLKQRMSTIEIKGCWVLNLLSIAGTFNKPTKIHVIYILFNQTDMDTLCMI